MENNEDIHALFNYGPGTQLIWLYSMGDGLVEKGHCEGARARALLSSGERMRRVHHCSLNFWAKWMSASPMSDDAQYEMILETKR